MNLTVSRLFNYYYRGYCRNFQKLSALQCYPVREMANSVPDRWIKYSALGVQIPGTRFIAFKVPLKEAICRNLPETMWHSPKTLIEQLPFLGLIIDLTATSRYYDPREFISQGIEYRKILCQGQKVPSASVVDRFNRTVDQFLEDNADNARLIGVHCTHGINRTGYLVCRYLVDKLAMKPSDAVQSFSKARGHPIERQNYVDCLSEPCESVDDFNGPSYRPAQEATRRRPTPYDNHSRQTSRAANRHHGNNDYDLPPPPHRHRPELSTRFPDDRRAPWQQPSNLRWHASEQQSHSSNDSSTRWSPVDRNYQRQASRDHHGWRDRLPPGGINVTFPPIRGWSDHRQTPYSSWPPSRVQPPVCPPPPGDDGWQTVTPRRRGPIAQWRNEEAQPRAPHRRLIQNAPNW